MRKILLYHTRNDYLPRFSLGNNSNGLQFRGSNVQHDMQFTIGTAFWPHKHGVFNAF